VYGGVTAVGSERETEGSCPGFRSARAVVRRSLADWPVVLAAWLLLVSATTLLATGVVYGDAVAAAGLHRVDPGRTAANRSGGVSCRATPRPSTVSRAIRPKRSRRAIAATGGEIARVVKTGSFADPAGSSDQVRDLMSFGEPRGDREHATLMDGAWPSREPFLSRRRCLSRPRRH